jgi:hypothetical protein
LTYPSTSVLASDGTGTSVLTPPSGFGDGFGDAFGGWQTTATAVLDATPGTAVLLPAVGTATLADPGVVTALTTEVIVLAELQLV